MRFGAVVLGLGAVYGALDHTAVDPSTFLTVHESENIRRRLSSGKPIPEEYYDRCHFWINAVRSREGLPALRRWREMESCSDDMAAYDFVQKRDNNRVHAAMHDGYGCKYGDDIGGSGQNSCPMYDGSSMSDAIHTCTVAMWMEKYSPGVEEDGEGGLKCKGDDEGKCMHYYILRGGRGYNSYDRVACGFYIDEDAEPGRSLYINQNFGAPMTATQEFFCGGTKADKPAQVLVEDCTFGTRDQYATCAGDFKYLHDYGCDYKDCDIHFHGACEDTHNACNYYNNPKNGGPLTQGSCTGRAFLWGGEDKWRNMDASCRKSCVWCTCDGQGPNGGSPVAVIPMLPESNDDENETENAPAPAQDAPAPAPVPETPAPAPCDPDYTGECEDRNGSCNWFNNHGYDLNYEWCKGRYIVKESGNLPFLPECRKSCEWCACPGRREVIEVQNGWKNYAAVAAIFAGALAMITAFSHYTRSKAQGFDTPEEPLITA